MSSASTGLRAHVFLDYALVVVGFASPWLFGFSQYTGATLYTLAAAAFGLGLNLLTDYPGGLWKVLPFKWHRIVELASPPPFIVVPWLFFSEAGAMPWCLSAIGGTILANLLLGRSAGVEARK